MDYKEKLRAFNSTEKYKSELVLLRSLLRGWDAIYCGKLDYGAGLCKTAYDLKADAYDVNDYKEHSVNYYLDKLPEKHYDYIYFMHSLAHIPNPIEVLKDLKARYNATITVITPNAYWLMLQGNNEYVPDPTVHKHYTMTQLRELFEEAGYEVTLLGQFGEETSGVNERIFLQAR